MIFGAVCFCLAMIGYVDYSRYIREDGIAISRNFYGTLRVKATASDTNENARWRLLHGVITHGEQYRNPKFRKLPTTYYGEASGIGRTIKTLRDFAPAAPQRVGLIGLGVGTLAAYGRAGDQYRIYELNPQVLELARTHFTYLSQSPATLSVQLGDARLVLEKEPDQKLDVLAIDAFSSDLTIEGIDGDQTLKTFSGEIRVRDPKGTVDAETFSADISVLVDAGAKGSVSFSSFSGDLNTSLPITSTSWRKRDVEGTLPGGAGRKMKFKTFSGDLELRTK